MKRSRAVDSSESEAEDEESQHSEDEPSHSDTENTSDSQIKSYPVVLKLGASKRVAEPPKQEENNDQEEEFHVSSSSESSSESDEFSEAFQRKEMRDFVVDSDEEERRPKRRLRQLPTRTSRRLASKNSGGNIYGSVLHESEEEDPIRAEIRAELRELRSPSPMRRNLRARQPVNYRILPPPPPEEVYRGDNGRGKARRTERRLFPVAGPFGGNDVVYIFKPRKEDVEKTLKELNNTESSSTTIVDSSVKGTTADSDPLGIDTNIDFDAIGGLKDYIFQLQEMVTLPLMYPELYIRFGITPPRGVLFHGPPGTGKTLMARALASIGSKNGRKITFFMRKGGDCLSKWVGEAERQLRVLFDEAKEKQPSIIFFDEIDGLAPVRSSKQEQIHASIVSTLLALMDGLDNRGQVVVIGATNRPDNIDPALRRPGRFDREFYFPLPNADARKQIVRIHTKKWNPPLEDSFVDKIAELTKGYGGADIKALCTESALNAIQRSVPQIYGSEKKLLVHPEKITVSPPDVITALNRILPSTVRGATGTTNAPLPTRVLPLVQHNFKEITSRLDLLMPKQKKLSPLEIAGYNVGSLDFEEQQLLDDFKVARVNRPRLLVHGEPGNGQEYISSAILNYLEGVSSHVLDLDMLFGDSTRTPEASIIQTLVEAKKRAPSVVLIPNVESWFQTISPQAHSIFFNCIRSFAPTDRILIIGIANVMQQELEPHLRQFFGVGACKLHIATDQDALAGYFKTLFHFVLSPPSFTMDIEDREKRVLPELPLAEEAPAPAATAPAAIASTEQAKKDNRTRSQLKVKLGALMDLFQKRYRRFKKPVVEDEDLLYLFLSPAEAPENPEYVKTDEDKIMEVMTGKTYHNMDLDIIEDRLWNGYYCEPKQFLQDLELIHEDSLTLGDRDRIHKSSELLANAQVAIDDIDSKFIDACRDLRKREAERQLREMEASTVSEASEVNGEINGEDGGLNGVTHANGVTPIGDEDTSESPQKPVAHEKEDGMEVDSEPSKEADSEPAEEPLASPEAAEIEETVDPAERAQSPSQEPSKPSASPEPERSIELDSELFESFKGVLFQMCTNADLDQLEVVLARLSEAAWPFRCDWNRNAMVQRLSKELDELQDILV